MARLDRVAKGNAVNLARQQPQEAADVFAIESPIGRKLPQDRAEFGAEHRKALCEKAGEPVLGFRELRLHHAITRALDRELKAVRHDLFPIRPARGFLPAVKGRVDLDRGQRARRKFELALLRQVAGIEYPAPRRIGPPADADADRAFAHSGTDAYEVIWPPPSRRA